MLRVDFDDRAELLAAAPDVYYVTDHYVGYTAVLVRLSCVTQVLTLLFFALAASYLGLFIWNVWLRRNS